MFIYTLLYAKRVASCGEDDEEEAYVSRVVKLHIKPIKAQKYMSQNEKQTPLKAPLRQAAAKKFDTDIAPLSCAVARLLAPARGQAGHLVLITKILGDVPA